jgi:hypothetical protein
MVMKRPMAVFLSRQRLTLRSRFARLVRLEAENLISARTVNSATAQVPVRLGTSTLPIGVAVLTVPSLLDAIIIVQSETVIR